MLYIPLNIKTEYSLLNSMIKVKDLVKKAKENNIKALALTDINLYGVYEFYKECNNNNIKPIIGLEIKIDNKKIILYCKNFKGYQNLIKIDELENYTLEDLNKYSDNLICILPYEEKEIKEQLKFNDIFISYNNEKINNLNDDNIIYMDEILYLDKDDYIYYKYLKGIKEGKLINEIDEYKDKYLKIPSLNDNILNNYKYIYDNCNLKLEKRNDLLPIYDIPENYTDFTYLKEMCRLGLKNRFGESVPKIYIDRIKSELEVIQKMGFCNYFLVVMDYVRFAKENGILVGPGRGSACGSLVAYTLNITDVDPIKYNLLFERFLNPMRVTMPDIDIDFEDNRRSEVIDYCINKYGNKKVAGIITFGTLASKQVIRDVARVMDLDVTKVSTVTKYLDSKLSLEENYNRNDKLKEIIKNNTDIKELFKIASKLEGLKRHTSVHAAGIVISSHDLDEVIPIVKHDNMYLTCFTMNYLEEIGLLKMDFLALKNLNIITTITEELKKDNINIDFNNIPLNDKKTMDIFKTANTIGIFQFDSEGMINFLRKLKPDNLEDLFSAIALFRPGPMSNIDTFIKRKRGLEKIDYFDPRLEDILKPTYGILVYQEQIMKISNVMAGYTLGEADILRRAMSKKNEDLILKEKDKFINGSINNGFSKEIATKVFNLILKFASYGFNRSHSVAYSIIAYKMAYLKANYNKYFMKSLLDNVIGTISTKDYINEARKNDIKILNPDINLSTNLFEVEDIGLRFPLSNIKNIGYNASITIMEERKNGPFKDIFDFIKRVYSSKVNKKIIVSLIDAGCFDSFNLNHKTITNNLDLIINYVELERELGEAALEPELIYYDEYNDKELLMKSYEVFGFYLSNHPVINYKSKNSQFINLDKIKDYFDKIVDVVILVEKIKKINTKKGEEMCFITGSDEFSNVEVVIFPKVFQNKNIKTGNVMILKGRVEKRFDEYQIIVNKYEVVE